MKKLLIGCLIIIVLGIVGFVAAGYFLYRAASPMVENARNYLENVGKLGELEKDVRNTASFAPPSNDELSQTQVDRFVRVQQSVRTALGQRVDEIEAKYKHLKAEAEPKREPTFTEVMSALGDMVNLVVDAKRAQVNALNQESFSSSEYSWVRSRVYQAAGIELSSVIDFQKIAEAARQGTGVENIQVPDLTPSTAVPAKNRELVKPHMEQMDKWLPLAFFGL
jgi:hypothetical protein